MRQWRGACRRRLPCRAAASSLGPNSPRRQETLLPKPGQTGAACRRQRPAHAPPVKSWSPARANPAPLVPARPHPPAPLPGFATRRAAAPRAPSSASGNACALPDWQRCRLGGHRTAWAAIPRQAPRGACTASPSSHPHKIPTAALRPAAAHPGLQVPLQARPVSCRPGFPAPGRERYRCQSWGFLFGLESYPAPVSACVCPAIPPRPPLPAPRQSAPAPRTGPVPGRQWPGQTPARRSLPPNGPLRPAEAGP